MDSVRSLESCVFVSMLVMIFIIRLRREDVFSRRGVDGEVLVSITVDVYACSIVGGYFFVYSFW